MVRGFGGVDQCSPRLDFEVQPPRAIDVPPTLFLVSRNLMNHGFRKKRN